MRVLGKPELSNAIKLVDLETLMSNFGPPSPRMGEDGEEEEDKNEVIKIEDDDMIRVV